MMKRHQVVFNLDDPDQKAMFDHVSKRTNVSGYLKRLIQRDMENGNVQIMNVTSTPYQQIDEENFDEEAIDQMLAGD